MFTNDNSKQAKDLVTILREANQEIDPKLQAMVRPPPRFGGGGRGGYRGGGGGYRGGRGGYRGGGGGGGYSGSNNAPLGRKRF